MEWLLNRRRFMVRHAEEEWEDTGHLTFLAETTGTFSFYIGANRTAEDVTSVSYSLNGGKTWITTSNVPGTAQTITTPTIRAGKRIIWKGIATRYGEGRTDGIGANNFRSTGNFKAYGNIMSMLYGDDFHIDSFPEDSTYTFNGMFYGCTGLTDISELVFPNNTASNCFTAMFRDCTSLTDASTILPTTLSSRCCSYMFQGCTNLTLPPELPATTTAEYCYMSMFNGCRSLVVAPTLSALTVAMYGYHLMFGNCSNLNTVRMYATNIRAAAAVSNMLAATSATGTFYKNSAATWADSSVVPSGWDVVTVTV